MRGSYGPAVSAWLRSLNPRLPRSVQMLQLGGLFNAIGNGLVLPFTLIYLHNVRDISLGTAGLVVATNAVVSMAAGPFFGMLVDRAGGRRMLAVALLFLAAGFGLYPLVHEPWLGFAAAALTGIGNGGFWASQSTLIAGLTPADKRTAAFAMQRVVMNLGIGLGGVAGGLIATTDRPSTFVVLFAGDALTFVIYLAILFSLVPEPGHGRRHGEPPGRYLDVLRHRAFVAVLALNTAFIFAGMSGFELLPVYAKNEAGVSEQAIGLVYFANTIVIVLAQLPIARLSQGRSRMRTLALMGLVWAVAWAIVPVAGVSLSGTAAALLIGVAVCVFAVGECLHGAVQGPLVTDLAEPRLLGRYMALSALSWQIGFSLGPAVGGFGLAAAPTAVWIVAALGCGLAGLWALALEPALPAEARRTPLAVPA
jgi:MFS family permease